MQVFGEGRSKWSSSASRILQDRNHNDQTKLYYNAIIALQQIATRPGSPKEVVNWQENDGLATH
jgi:hypothetical protein